MHDAASRINASFWARNGFGALTEDRAAARAVIRQELAHINDLRGSFLGVSNRVAAGNSDGSDSEGGGRN